VPRQGRGQSTDGPPMSESVPVLCRPGCRSGTLCAWRVISKVTRRCHIRHLRTCMVVPVNALCSPPPQAEPTKPCGILQGYDAGGTGQGQLVPSSHSARGEACVCEHPILPPLPLQTGGSPDSTLTRVRLYSPPLLLLGQRYRGDRSRLSDGYGISAL
jgi:hypothetical protein